MEIKNELLDELLKDYRKPEDILGEDGLLKRFVKAVLERAMNAELTHHLGYEKHNPVGYNTGNSRNGTSGKTIKGDFGEMAINVPRDRAGTFDPQILPKHQTRFSGFDEKIISMYARGMTTREIEAHLKDIYGVDVTPGLISQVTDAVSDDVKTWQNRALEPIYGIVYLDALYVKMRHEGRVENRAVYVAIGVNLEGKKDVLGLWSSNNEGAKFWLSVLNELKSRGVKDMLIVCVDGLKGFPQAIETAFPLAQVQLCMVHMVRASLNYVNWKERKKVAADLKPIYSAATADEAAANLDSFVETWGNKYKAIGKLWKENWSHVIPFFSFPAELRKVIYTTNAVEALNRGLRKIIKNRGAFPSEESALKLLYLALNNISAKWNWVHYWRDAMNQIEILWGDRIRAAQRS